jgi:hypothetical protein
MTNVTVKTDRPRRPLTHRIGAVFGGLLAAAAGLLLLLVILWGCAVVFRQITGA